MERRNFFKALAGVYAGATTFFSCKYFEKRRQVGKQAYKTMQQRKLNHFWHIEIPIVYHCNLNCAYCNHFSPLAPEYFMPIDVFERDILRLRQLTKGKIEEIVLLGGEPLLHPDIDKLIDITRLNFPKTEISIYTNGLTLTNKNDIFWKKISESNTHILISNYILNEDILNLNQIDGLFRKFNINYAVFSKNMFNMINLSKNKIDNCDYKYLSCERMLNSALLDNGILYSCCIAQGIQKFFNKKFPKYAIPFAQDDTLDIHKVSSLQEILDFLKKPKTYCAYCHYQDNTFLPNAKKWKLSKRELSEWYVK